MDKFLKIAVTLWTLIFLVFATPEQSLTYRHPHQVLHDFKRLEYATSQLTDEHLNQVELIARILSPKNVLNKLLDKNLEISSLCFNQSLYGVESLLSGGTEGSWSLKMIDAWGKPGSGISTGNLAWLGDFDECQNIVSYYNSSYTSGNSSSLMPESFEGQYCSIGTSLNSAGLSLGIPVGFSIGSCFPSGCSVQDIYNVVQTIIEEVNTNSTLKITVSCQEKNLEYSTGAIVTIVLYCIMGALCIVGTIYDAVRVMNTPTPEGDGPHLANGTAINGSTSKKSEDTEILINPQDKPYEHKPGALGEFLMCFSLYTNGYKLLSTKQPPGSLKCLHGIRFLSMTWVILGHTLVFSFSSIGNFMVVGGWLKRWTFQVIMNATVSVDSFFVLSALLTSYLFLKQLEKKKTTPVKFFITVPIMYLHRYLRLTPAYGFMILYYTCLSLYMYSSPLKPVNTTAADPNCVTNWWGAIFYMNNFIESNKMCAGWGWYLSNDFQFFIVTPFVVYLMYITSIGGVVLSIAMVIGSTIAATSISVRDDLGLGLGGVRDPKHPPANAQQNQNMSDYYFPPWCRYQSFGVGVIFGFILWKCRGQLPISRVVNLCLWAVSGAIMLAILYGPFEIESGGRIATVAEAAIYNGWSRTAWSLALGYIILACCLGRGGWVNELLSWSGFVPLSRLTYCAYLVHPVIMTIASASNKNKIMWTDITFISMFAAYTFLAYAVAFPFSLMFEAPFMLIDKKYLTGKLSNSVK